MTKRKRYTALNMRLSDREDEILNALEQKGIKPIDVLRRGLELYEADLVGDLTQNNVS